MIYTPVDTKNLYKHPYFRFPQKGTKGYKMYNKAMLQLKVKTNMLISPEQFEASRRLLSKLKKDTDAILKLKHIQVPQSKKPLQTRMGKGKGKPFAKWTLPARKGWPIISIYNWFELEKFQTIYSKVQKKYKTDLKIQMHLPHENEQLEDHSVLLAWCTQKQKN